jgi:hypothetical protein
MMDPRMYWLILLFVRNSEDLFLTAVGKNTFRKEICVRIPVYFFCVNDVLENLSEMCAGWKLFEKYVVNIVKDVDNMCK